MIDQKTAEQQARDMLERMGVPEAQSYTAGELVELANLIADARAVAAERERFGSKIQWLQKEARQCLRPTAYEAQYAINCRALGSDEPIPDLVWDLRLARGLPRVES